MLPPHDPTRSEPPADVRTTRPAGDPAAGGVPAAVGEPSASAGRYELGAEIARGGMGAVYRATDTAFGRQVAVKVLLDKYAPTSGTARRFHDEARITGQLQHPNIPAVFDLGILPDGRPFLAMKLIKGDTLDELLKGQPDRGRFVAVFEKVCEAVAYAHAHGVVHRDLKPSNVMVGNFGEVQVMDWGLAKVLADGHPARAEAPDETAAGTAVRSLRDGEDQLTQAGSVLGTPAYMPPEQALGAVHEVGIRSDVFGLGGILATILTKKPPFMGDTAETTRVMAARAEVAGCFERLDGCGADPELVALCKRCLAPKQEDRPADAGAVAKAVAALRAAADERARQAELDKVKAEGEVAAAAVASAERRKRRRVWLGAVAGLAAAVVGGLTSVLTIQRQANADLAAKNAELASANDRERQRFNLALEAVRTFHAGVSEDVLLKQAEFADLRGRLLRQARDFYRKLQELLTDQADRDSRRALARSYIEVGKITREVETFRDALAVQQRALALLEGLAADSPDDTDLRHELGRCWLALAELHQARDGGTADASAALTKAQEALETVVAARPSNVEARTDLALSLWLVAGIHSQEGRHEKAIEIQRRVCADLDALLAADPAAERVRHELVRSLDNLGLYLHDANRPEEALAAYARSSDLAEALVRDHPADPKHAHELARTLGNMALSLLAVGRSDDAAAAYARAREVLAVGMKAHPTLLLFRRDSTWIESDAARSLILAGKNEAALQCLELAQAAREALLKANPDEVRSQQQLAWVLRMMAWVHRRAGRFDRGRPPAERAVAVAEKLAGANRDRPDLQEELLLSYCGLGGLEVAAGRPAIAREWFEKALGHQRRLVQANPSSATARAGEATALRHLGIALQASGRPAEAIEHYRRSLAQLEGVERPTPVNIYDMACCRALIAGAAAAPGSGLTPAEAEAEASAAVALIRRSFGAGYKNLAWVRDLDTDLDAMRGRPDFKALIAELQAGAKRPAR
jgi:tetratricopeptide (TPR) repeat protein